MSFSDIKEREKEEKRNIIVDAAEKLFFEKGFDSVSMEDIAKDVGVNRATLYLYFKNKDSMYFAVVLRGVRIMNQALVDAASSKSRGIDKLESIGWAYFEFYRTHGDYFRLLAYFGSGRFAVEHNDDAREVHRLLHATFDITCEAVAAGMKDGTVRNDITPEELTVFLITSSENAINLPVSMRMCLRERGIEYQMYLRTTMALLGSCMRKKG